MLGRYGRVNTLVETIPQALCGINCELTVGRETLSENSAGRPQGVVTRG
jgi:hypothetical protein